ncbi:polysaccharide deacetylase family protein [bacterium]|nr:polysaccharide deacetylase family protein [bacterium]
MARGRFIVCFDFELAWGRFDKVFDESYLSQVRLTRKEVVPSLLAVLERHNVPATWAVVGHLMLRECNGVHSELEPYRPEHCPDWFSRDEGGVDDGDSVWMCRDLVKQIAACPTPQELASHSFSHVDFSHPALSRKRAAQELELARDLISEFGQEMKTHIFPRGRTGHLDVLRDAGVRVYRTSRSPGTGFKSALGQFVTEALARTPPLVTAARDELGMLNVEGGMLFNRRGRYRSAIPVSRRVVRAIKGMNHAVKSGGVFLLWNHPIDFATSKPAMMTAFDEICAYAARLRDEGRLETIPVRELY